MEGSRRPASARSRAEARADRHRGRSAGRICRKQRGRPEQFAADGGHQILRLLLDEMILQVRRQIGDVQQRTGVDGHHVLHAVFELANVAGPVVGKHHFHRLRRHAVVAADARKKMVDQRRDVFRRSRSGARRMLITFRRK